MKEGTPVPATARPNLDRWLLQTRLRPNVPTRLNVSSVLLRSPSHPNFQFQWLPQKSFSSLQRARLLHLELKIPEHSSHNACHLHLGHIPAHTRPWAIAERDEGVLLSVRNTIPPIWYELICVRTPDLFGVVDRVGGDGKNGPRGKCAAQDLNRCRSWILWSGHGRQSG